MLTLDALDPATITNAQFVTALGAEVAFELCLYLETRGLPSLDGVVPSVMKA